jgi:hypothetical protein
MKQESIKTYFALSFAMFFRGFQPLFRETI